MLRRTWFITILVVILAASLVVMAQQPTSGTLAGKVVDNEGKPLPGATITITGPGGDRSAQTDAQGDFEFRFVPAGTFKVKVDMAGFAPMQFSTVPVNAGQTTRVPVKLIAGKTEEVTVTSATPIIDVKRVGVQTTFKTDSTISTLPIGRNFVSAVAFAPGVVSGGGTGAGNYSISGSSGLENSYLIDGVNITSSGYGGVGTYSQSYGSLGTGITSDFLEEVQVKTAGFEAEYGQALGGVITGTVKSGTNDLRGRVNLYFSPRSMEAYGTDPQLIGGTSVIHNRQRQDIGLQAGGPIVKDRLFWFVAYNPVKEWNDLFVAATSLDNAVYQDELTRGVYPNSNVRPAAAAGAVRGSREYQNYAAKLNAVLTPNHRLEATFFGDPSKGYGGRGTNASDPIVLTGTNGEGATSFTPAAWGSGGATSTIKWGADQQSLKYTGLFGTDWFVEGQFSNRKNTFKEVPLNEFAYTDLRPQLLTGVANNPRVGGIGFFAPIQDKSMDYALKLTKTFGNHEVKAGVQYFDLKYFEAARYSGPVFNVPFAQFGGSDILIPTTTGASVQVRGGLGAGNCDPANPIYIANCATAPIYRVTRTRFNDPGETSGKELSFFLQDTWSITDKWTLKAGLRSQKQKLTGSVPFTLGFSRDTAHPGYFLPTPTTYLPKSYEFAQEYSPRVGISYDPSGNGKTKIYGNFARYFERVPSDLAIRQFSNEVGASRFEFTDPLLTTRRGATGNALLQGINPGTIADGTKLPYKDEFVVGWQQLVRPDLSVEVRGIYRKQGRVLEDTQDVTVEEIENYYYGRGYELPNPFPNYPDQRGFGAYNLSNPGENSGPGFGNPKLDYKALELQIEKRLSDNWAGFFNYRYSILKGNYEGLFRNDNGQSDPNITSLFDFPNSHLMRGQFQPGFMNNDRPHVLHVGGTYFFKNGIEAGGIFNWQSGTPRTPLLAHPNYQNAGELPGRDPIYTYWDQALNGGYGDWAKATSCAGNPGDTPCFLYDYTDAPRGSNGRVPDLATIDVHVGWKKDFKDMTLKLAFDISNLFNAQEPQAFDDDIESTVSVADPNYLRATGYQAPRSVRLSVVWDW